MEGEAAAVEVSADRRGACCRSGDRKRQDFSPVLAVYADTGRQLLSCQYLYLCTSKASKLSTT